MLFIKKFPAFLLCLMLVTGMVAVVPAGVVVASDDVGGADSIPFLSSQDGFPVEERAHVAYFTYAGQEEYAFCVYSDYELIYECNYCDDDAKKFFNVFPWSDGMRKYNGDNTELYFYKASTGMWYKSSQSSYNSGMPEHFRRGDSFRLLYTNTPCTRYDINTNGTFSTKIIYNDFVSIYTPSSLSFQAALSPGRTRTHQELVGTVQGITWSKTMGEVVGLVPLLLGLVISFLGLRKALRFFSSLLRRA